MYSPPGIRDKGLIKHLEDSKHLHNNYGYTDFLTMHDQKVNTANMARLFNVDWRTMKKWIAIYKEEQRQ